MSKKNKNKKSKFGLFAALAAIAGVGIYFFTKKDSEEAAQKPEWWCFAHPQKKYEEITNAEIEDLFEKIFIPGNGYTTCDGTQYVNVENPGTVKSIIYIPTGEVITDIDNSFFSKLITYNDSIKYGFKDINGNSIYGITELTKAVEANEEAASSAPNAETAEAKTAVDLAVEAAKAAEAAEAATDTNTKVVSSQNAVLLAKEALAAAEEVEQNARWYLFPDFDLESITQEEVDEIFKNVALLDKDEFRIFDKNTNELFYSYADKNLPSEFDRSFFNKLRKKAKEKEYETLTISEEVEKKFGWDTIIEKENVDYKIITKIII